MAKGKKAALRVLQDFWSSLDGVLNKRMCLCEHVSQNSFTTFTSFPHCANSLY